MTRTTYDTNDELRYRVLDAKYGRKESLPTVTMAAPTPPRRLLADCFVSAALDRRSMVGGS